MVFGWPSLLYSALLIASRYVFSNGVGGSAVIWSFAACALTWSKAACLSLGTFCTGTL